MREFIIDEAMFQVEPAILVQEAIEPWLISAQKAISYDLTSEDLVASSVPADGWGINE